MPILHAEQIVYEHIHICKSSNTQQTFNFIILESVIATLHSNESIFFANKRDDKGLWHIH